MSDRDWNAALEKQQQKRADRVVAQLILMSFAPPEEPMTMGRSLVIALGRADLRLEEDGPEE